MAVRACVIEGRGECNPAKLSEYQHIMRSLWEEISQLADFDKVSGWCFAVLFAVSLRWCFFVLLFLARHQKSTFVLSAPALKACVCFGNSMGGFVRRSPFMKRDDSASPDYQANVHAKKEEKKTQPSEAGQLSNAPVSERASACICTLEHALKHASGTITSASTSSKRSHRNPFDLVRFGTAAGRGCGIDDGHSCDSHAILIRIRHVITYTLYAIAYLHMRRAKRTRAIVLSTLLLTEIMCSDGISRNTCTVLSFGMRISRGRVHDGCEIFGCGVLGLPYQRLIESRVYIIATIYIVYSRV